MATTAVNTSIQTHARHNDETRGLLDPLLDELDVKREFFCASDSIQTHVT